MNIFEKRNNHPVKNREAIFGAVIAFTLIELLVVIGLIGVLAAGIGIALKTNDGGVSLQGAQASLNSMISAARSQAALKQKRAGVFIETTSSSDGFLSCLQIAYESGNGPDGWSAAGTTTMLPRDICVVPDMSPSLVPLDSTTWPTTDDSIVNGISYDKKVLSTVLRDATAIELEGFPTRKFMPLFIFEITGIRSKKLPTNPSTAGDRIVLAPILRPSQNQIIFTNPQNVRGLNIGVYGISVLINDAQAF
jgi:prepilin-type N-terminal cleavage/methylation domain-containing protein